MRFTLQFGLVTLLATGLCAPTPASKNIATRTDEDAKVIYPDYRRSLKVTSEGDEDAKVIYPDYRRSVKVVSEGDEDSKVIYPDY
ncbi:hypothetical protein K505DRAFT_378651 [Melanomma pulvis-pyrius CBS 109.77]|uniref:Uncharacterized protein n=1 Tax=Melanomma pulvis-pyrius CBS 109.77 TaxID=1314802 RepID=A0A6A6WY46_9PLEO|nr:hypothetical protein K505DRAFT_378651 [Melanomma pulvis-pyrius CBS 109.77]